MKPRVFVVNEPVKVDGRRAIDVSPARRYGELVFLSAPGADVPNDPEATLSRMRKYLYDYNQYDFILPVGHPLLIGWAAILAARATGGSVTMLHWQGRARGYVPVQAQIYQP